MLKGEPVTAIIPVRGGSKGIPGKNLRRLGKFTLLERAIKLAQAAPQVDRVLVTTDDPEMFGLAKDHGVAAPALRPAHLASDAASTVDVVLHLIEQAAIDRGLLLLLQATSPLRTLADLAGLCDCFEETPDAQAIVSLCRHEEPHPEKLQVIQEGRVKSYLGGTSHRTRQSLPDVYALNGAFYLISRDVFQREKTFLPPGTLPFVMPPERSLNLDTQVDWDILTAMTAAGHWRFEEYE